MLLLATIAFLQYFIGYSVIFWLPTILKNQSGLSDAQVGLLGAMPYVVALFAMLFNGAVRSMNSRIFGSRSSPYSTRRRSRR